MTIIDGRDHRWDDLGEAVRTIAHHYVRLIRTIIADLR